MQYHEKNNMTREELLRDDSFINDAAMYMSQRTEKSFDTREELLDAFVNQRRMATVNEIDAYGDYKYVSGATDDEKTRAGKLFLTFDKIDKPTSTSQLILDYGEGLFTAPSTYLSLIPGVGLAAKFGLTGATSMLAKGAVTGATRTINQTAKALATKSTKRRIMEGAVSAGTVEGAIGGGQGALYTASRKETGAEPYKDQSVLAGAAIGTAFGAIPGTVIGGSVAGWTARKELQALDLVKAGTTARKERLKLGGKAVAELVKTNNELYKKVSNALDPLKERLGKELAAGEQAKKKLLPDFLQDDFTATLDADVIRNMKGAAVEILQAAGVKAEDFDIKSGARLSEIMYNALIKGGKKLDDVDVVGTEKLAAIMSKYGLTQEQLSNIFLAEMSHAGRILAIGGHSRRALIKSLSGEHKVIQRMGLGDENFQTALEMFEKMPGRARELFENIDKARLGLMTIQTATTARNTANATARTFLFALDNLGHGVLDMATGKFSQGAARASSGLRLWNAMTFNQAEANAMRLLFHEEMPRTFGRLYMQNADVSAAMGIGSGFANFSRKLNVLNTFSDNAFKRAVFMSELQSVVGPKKLRELIRTGKFSTIPKETIAKAMNEALSFTYQKSYRGINGKKTRPSRLLEDWFQNPIARTVIPFPKFIMNSVEFMYTHAPVLGLADVPFKLGKGIVKERLAKQVTGAGMLYGAIQLRAQQGPDAKWWEWYDEDTGEYENSLAFYGPFAIYMLAADIILRSNMRNKTVSDVTGLPLGNIPLVIGEQTQKNWARVSDDTVLESMFKEDSDTKAQFFKAVFGSTFRTGTGLEIIDDLYKDIKVNMEESNLDSFKRSVAKFGGNWVNTFGVPLGEVRDIYGLIDDEYKVIRDPEAMVNPLDLFIAKMTRSMPISGEGELFGLVKGFGIPEGLEATAKSPTVRGELRRERSGRKQLTGRGTARQKDIVQRALDLHRIPTYRAFPKLKDPRVDAIAKKLYQDYTDEYLVPNLASAAYKSVADTPEGGAKQKLMLESILDFTKGKVYDEVINVLGRRQADQIDKGQTKELKETEEQLTYMYKVLLSELPEPHRKKAKNEFKAGFGTPKNYQDWAKMYDMGRRQRTIYAK